MIGLVVGLAVPVPTLTALTFKIKTLAHLTGDTHNKQVVHKNDLFMYTLMKIEIKNHSLIVVDVFW